MSFLNTIFAPKPQEQQQQPANQKSNQNPQQQSRQQDQSFNQNQGPNPNGNGNPDGSQSSQQPNKLDAYAKLWDTPSTEADKPPSFTIDGKVLDTVSSQQDFMKGINPELIQKATSGDVNSLMEIIHNVGRNVYRTSMEHNSMLTDKFVGAREGYNEKGFSKKVRGELTNQSLSSIPNSSHPAVRKQLTMLAKQFQEQHPDATPAEIVKMAQDYMSDLTEAMQDPSKKQQEQNQGKPKETDWDAYFDEANNASFN